MSEMDSRVLSFRSVRTFSQYLVHLLVAVDAHHLLLILLLHVKTNLETILSKIR